MFISNKRTSSAASAHRSHESVRRQAAAFLTLALLIFQSLLIASPQTARAATPAVVVSTDIVISQVYGGGGNTGATLRNDFIELFNRGTAPVDVSGWSVQYASSGGSSWQVTNLTNVTIQPGRYYLVQESAGAGGTQDLPTPDAVGTIPMSGTNGKVALVTNQTALTCGGSPAACSGISAIKDFVGYGSATTYEGTGAAPVLTNTTAAIRNSGGCTDSDDNAADFMKDTPNPHNRDSPTNSCGGGPISTNPAGTGAASPDSLQAGATTLLTVAVTPGQNPPSTNLAVSGDLSAIGGAASQAFFDDGTNGDAAANDNTFSYSATVAAGTSPGGKTLPVTITDAQTRAGSTSISLTVAAPPETAQPLPFSQNWSNTNLITTDDNWSGVPGIVGYRGDDLTTSTGTDPQTILTDGSGTPVNVVANQTNPDTVTSGGNYEFELSDPTIAFQGSGTADAPHIVLNLKTTGSNNITVFYNLRDIDGSADNAVQPVALQYRVGNSGNYTNVPAAFVADATTGPNEATKVTPVAVVLPSNADDQPLVQLRIITANAVGSDEFVGIDDISVVSNGTVPLSGSGSATPNQVQSGTSVLLTVSVTPATNPASTNITVAGNLSSIGGSAVQQFFDDGTNGDQTAGDNVFSYSAQVSANSSGGSRTVPVSIADGQNRTASTSISLTVIAAADPGEHLTLGNPSGATTDINNPFNYLLAKPQYAVSYHRDRGIPNWVSWHLDSSWIGSAPRQNDFRADPTLPDEWYRVTEFDYSGSGFDRGHHTPSGDRTRSIPDNSATFFMTNMMPQAPDNNQGPWEKLESDSRSIVGQGNELYIVGAGVGTGGTGSNGGTTNTIAGGRVTVPSYTWKVILVLPAGGDDVSRVNENTRTIAVIMPNTQGIRNDPWQKYLATVDQVEALTGYDFFSEVPVDIQNVIEARLDPASNANPQTIAAGNYTDLDVTTTPNKELSGDITVSGNLNLGGTIISTNNFCVTLGSGATVTRTTGYVNYCVEKQFSATTVPLTKKTAAGSAAREKSKAAAPAAVFEYPVGTPNGYSPVTLDPTVVGADSSLLIRAFQTVQPNVPSPALALRRYWTLTETGDITTDLTFKYLDQDIPGGINESNFKIQRYEGTFTEFPTVIDAAANTARTTGVSQFSDWTLLAPAQPTAAAASIEGRVVTASGRAVPNAVLSLTDGGGSVHTAHTNPFGYYRFRGVATGESYIVGVRHKSYTFNSQVITLTDNLTDLTFVAF